MAKDKRIKGCSNPLCQKAEKKSKFKAEENFCPICGSELVFVCAKCHGPLEDEGPGHRTCCGCEAAASDRKAKVVDSGKKMAAGAGSAALAVASVLLRKK